MHAAIDPEARIIALRLFDGVIKIINLNSSNKQLTAATQRMDEIDVLDMQFLYTSAKPTLALLYQDQSVSETKSSLLLLLLRIPYIGFIR